MITITKMIKLLRTIGTTITIVITIMILILIILQEVKPTDEEKMEEVAENMFNPFQIKQNMRLAPLVRYQGSRSLRVLGKEFI